MKTTLAVITWRRLGLLLKLAGYAGQKWGTPRDIRQAQGLEFSEIPIHPDRGAVGAAGAGGTGSKLPSPDSPVLPNSPTPPKSPSSPSISMHGYGADSPVNGVMDADEVEREAKVQKCFFRPESKFRTSWDIIQVALLLYVVLTVPLRIGFDLAVEFGTVAFWFDLFVDLYFLVDIVINFRTAYLDNNGVLIIQRKLVTVNYLKGWCIVDIISCLPVNYITMIQSGGNSAKGKEVRLFKMLRMLRLAKLLRVARIARLLQRYQEHLRPLMDTFGGFLLCIVIALFSHIVACMWYMIGSSDQIGWSSQDQTEVVRIPGWVERKFRCGGAQTDAFSGGTALQDEYIVDPEMTKEEHPTWCEVNDHLSSRYIMSAYWALMTISTVGYGDITAHTDTEIVFSFIVMLFGAIIFAMITGTIASRMMAQKGAVQVYNTKMDEVRQFLHNKKVPTLHRRRVMAYYEALYEGSHVYDEKEILQKLPLSVSGPVVESIYRATMDTVPLFRQLTSNDDGTEIMVKICMELEPKVALPQDHVLYEGRRGEEMYLIEKVSWRRWLCYRRR